MLYNKDWDYKLNPVADVLMKAADLLVKYGHVKFIRGDFFVGMCALGALQAAQGEANHGWDTALTLQASRAVMDMLAVPSDMHYPHAALANWNNKPERTGQEVIDAFREAAKSLIAA